MPSRTRHLPAHLAARHAFQAIHEPRKRDLRRIGDEPIHVVALAFKASSFAAKVRADLRERAPQSVERAPCEDLAPVPSHEDQVLVHRKDPVPALTDLRLSGA